MTQALDTSYLYGQAPKLSELRAKTDRQLHAIINSELKAGLRFAALADVERADRALARVKRLLPVLSEQDRRAFAAKLSEVQETVDRLERRSASGMAQTASAF